MRKRLAVLLPVALGLTLGAAPAGAVATAGGARTWRCSTVSPLVKPFKVGEFFEVSSQSAARDARIVAFASGQQLLPDHPLPQGTFASLVYVKDRRTGRLEAVGDRQGVAPLAMEPQLSADGRWLEWINQNVIYLEDRATRKVTTLARGQEARMLDTVGLSENGRYSAFATNMGALTGDPTLQEHVVVLDRLTGRRSVVPLPKPSGPPQGSALPNNPTLSTDGRHVAYTTAPPGNDQVQHAYIYDLSSRVLRDATAGSPDTNVQRVSLSRTGRYIAYETWATSSPNPGSLPQINFRDLRRRTTTFVSVLPKGAHLSAAAVPSISESARYVMFNADGGVYVRDLKRRATSFISPPSPLPDGWSMFGYPLSGDGRHALLTIGFSARFSSTSFPYVADANRSCRHR